MKLFLMFLVITFAYTLLYVGYTYAAKSMSGRVWYVAAVVVGTVVGSTLGQRWFK